VAFAPDGDRLASISMGDKVHLWDSRTGQEIFQRPGGGRYGVSADERALSFTPDGTHLLAWGLDRRLRKWELPAGTSVVDRALDAHRPANSRMISTHGPVLEMGKGAFSADGQTFFR